MTEEEVMATHNSVWLNPRHVSWFASRPTAGAEDIICNMVTLSNRRASKEIRAEIEESRRQEEDEPDDESKEEPADKTVKDDKANDEEEKLIKQRAVHLLTPLRFLIAWLWLVATKRIKPGAVGETPEEPGIGRLCREVLNKIVDERGRSAKTKSRGDTSGTGETHDEEDDGGLDSTEGMKILANALGDAVRESGAAMRESLESVVKNSDSNGAAVRETLTSFTQLQEKLVSKEEREAEKKKLTHCMTKEVGSLFRLLSAYGWSDREPEVNPLMKQLIGDKDASKALNLLRGELDRANMRCTVSKACLVQFLAEGFVVPNFKSTPSGLCLFMFHPVRKAGNRKPRTAKETQDLIRSMFGKGTIDDETVKLYAKTDLYLPKEFDELHRQVISMLKFLDMLTGRKSIASDGYREALRLMDKLSDELIEAEAHVNMLWVRLGYFFDMVFQKFVTRLAWTAGDTPEGESVIARARRTLRGYMADKIAKVLDDIDVGSIPTLRLPDSLSPGQTPPSGSNKNHVVGAGPSGEQGGTSSPNVGGSKKRGREDASPASDGGGSTNPAWWNINTGQLDACRLPSNKKFKDFFDHTVGALKPNCANWPKVPHHKSGENRFICIRYQTEGKCRGTRCRSAHILPQSMEPETRELVISRCRSAYSGETSEQS